MGVVPVYNNVPPPTVVPAGVFSRVRRLVKNIKSNENYNDSIGNELGIIGAEMDTATLELKTVLKIKIDADKPRVNRKKVMQILWIFMLIEVFKLTSGET